MITITDYDDLVTFCDERDVHDATTARFLAQEWQRLAADEALSYGELVEWQNYFSNLAKQFNLTDEFKENGII
jgi:hypothetical protein